ncbi:HTH domain-containing protein [Bacillus sp. TH44]|nr:HTH domain-containing protein [Bacillus sp. TH44]
MSKINRLFNILLQINTKNKFTVQELADEFNVSKRTILRDLEELSTLGIPLYSERGPHGGYRLINKNGLLPPLHSLKMKQSPCFSLVNLYNIMIPYHLNMNLNPL